MMIALEEQFPKAQIIVAVDRDSRGKGWAVRKALEQAEGDIICFIDGDMDIDCMEILNLLQYIGDFDIVTGRKKIRGIFSRKLITFLSRIYIKILFGLDDPQTGIKLFRRGSLMAWKEDKWLFDIEILYKAKRCGFTIKSVDIEAKPSTRKQSFSCIMMTLFSSIKLFWRLKNDRQIERKESKLERGRRFSWED